MTPAARAAVAEALARVLRARHPGFVFEVVPADESDERDERDRDEPLAEAA